MDPTTALLKTMNKLEAKPFSDFLWHLEKTQDIEKCELEGINRHGLVDLLLQRFPQNALDVTIECLELIKRHDLVGDLSKNDYRGPQLNHLNPLLPSGRQFLQKNVQAAEKRLFSVRNDLIRRVSDSILNQLLDQLLQQSIINDLEMESAKAKASRAEKAGDLIDMVRKKGPEASSALIAALCEVDPFLSKALNLI